MCWGVFGKDVYEADDKQYFADCFDFSLDHQMDKFWKDGVYSGPILKKRLREDHYSLTEAEIDGLEENLDKNSENNGFQKI
jgi:hypothetical protein